MLNRRQFLVTAGTVLITASGCSKLKLPVSLPAARGKGPRPLRVALMSDPHTQEKGSLVATAVNGKLGRAVADYEPLAPDFWLFNGDIADSGLPGQYEAFKKIMATVAKPEQLLVTTGNHEFYDMAASDAEELRRFREAFQLAKPYQNRLIGDLHFVLLADEQWKTAPRNRDWAWLSADQLRWFEQVLAEHRDKFTVVCLHQPLQDTVVWTAGNNEFAGCGQIDDLRAIISRNAQIKLWFSGHTHMGAAISGNTVRKNGVTYVGLGSTFYQYLRSDDPDAKGDWPGETGWKKDLNASESRLMEIWPDKVVVRARDHARQTWIDGQEITIARTRR